MEPFQVTEEDLWQERRRWQGADGKRQRRRSGSDEEEKDASRPTGFYAAKKYNSTLLLFLISFNLFISYLF
jgi:hypothetical protein